MNQKLLAIGFILLIIIGCTGCITQPTNTEKNKFIGKWNGEYLGSWDGVWETEATFYKNDTVKTIYYQITDGERNEVTTDWAVYEIKNGKLCVREAGNVEDESTCNNYTFSDNDTRITITVPDDTSFVYILTRIDQ